MTDPKWFSFSHARLVFFRTLLALLVLATGAPVFAQLSEDLESIEVTETPEDVEAYWTPERMAAAEPTEIVEPAEIPGDLSIGPDGPPYFIEPTEATQEETIVFPAPFEAEPMPPDAEDVRPPLKRRRGGERVRPTTLPAGIAPWVYSRYSVFPAGTERVYPYATVGKIFYTRPDGRNFVCSGASITAWNRSVVWTAGHCVFTRGLGWHRNVLFVPARRNFGNPFGVWTGRSMITTRNWVVNGWLEMDYGAIIVNRGGPMRNRCLNTAVGGLGMAINLPRVQHWHALGYPAAPPFTGEIQQVCTAALAGTERPTGGNPPTNGIGCDQNGGTSGGPWIVDFFERAVPGTNRVNSNSSYIRPGRQRLFGPYFNNNTLLLYNNAARTPVPGC